MGVWNEDGRLPMILKGEARPKIDLIFVSSALAKENVDWLVRKIYTRSDHHAIMCTPVSHKSWKDRPQSVNLFKYWKVSVFDADIHVCIQRCSAEGSTFEEKVLDVMGKMVNLRNRHTPTRRSHKKV